MTTRFNFCLYPYPYYTYLNTPLIENDFKTDVEKGTLSIQYRRNKLLNNQGKYLYRIEINFYDRTNPTSSLRAVYA